MTPSTNQKLTVGLTAFLAGAFAVSMLAAGIDYPASQYVGSGVVDVNNATHVISATLPNTFTNATCDTCTMPNATMTALTLTSPATLDGSPIATSATVATALTGYETTSHASATYQTIAGMSAYSNTTAMNAAIAAAQPQKAHLTTATDGTLTWTYPVACGAGVVPYVQALARGASGSTDVLNPQLDGVQTNTQAKFRVTRTAVTTVALLGLNILSVPSSPGAVPLDLQISCT